MSKSTKTEQIAKAINLYYYPCDSEMEIRAQKRNNQWYRTCVEYNPSVVYFSKRRYEIFKQTSDIVVYDEYIAAIAEYMEQLPSDELDRGKYALLPCYTNSTLKGNRITTENVICVAYKRNGELFIDFFTYSNITETDKATDVFTLDFSNFVVC